jgi:hypothetical protein
LSISLSMSDMDVGSVNVTAGSYIVVGTARLRNTTSGTSNADCDKASKPGAATAAAAAARSTPTAPAAAATTAVTDPFGLAHPHRASKRGESR